MIDAKGIILTFFLALQRWGVIIVII